MAAINKNFAEVNRTRLYYEIAGSGEPLVLIHGYTLDTRMWDAQFDIFAKHYRTLRYDLRGFGKSALPAAESYSHYDDLRALLIHLGIERAHLVGQSMGGAVAVDFALTYPHMVSSLVLVDVSALGGFPRPDSLKQLFSAMATAASNGDMVLAKQHWLNGDWFASAHKHAAADAKLKQMIADYSGWHFAGTDPLHKLTPPANERLAEIRAPTLIVLGELDIRSYNYPIAERLQQCINGAEKVVMTGVGHMSNMEDPDRFNDIVLSFLAKC